MNRVDRVTLITQRLQAAFSPTELEVQDDSAEHLGHAGSRDGAGHYSVLIAANCFKGKSRIAIHREIYQVLNDLIPQQIHALKITIKFEKEMPLREQNLFLCAKELEEHTGLKEEIATWDKEFGQDGLDSRGKCTQIIIK